MTETDAGGSIEQLLSPWETVCGGVPGSRLLPCRERRSLASVVEIERVGPEFLDPGGGLQSGPSPRVGVATLTYPIQGEIVHRDSRGTEQLLAPGEVHLCVAGRGLTVSERSPADVVSAGGVLDAIRLTVLLAEPDRTGEPRFESLPADSLAVVDGPSWFARILAGRGLGAESPRWFGSDLFLADVTLAAGASFEFDDCAAERGVLVAERAARIDGREVAEGDLAVLAPGGAAVLSADHGARLLLIGGPPCPDHLFVQDGVAATDEESHGAILEAFAAGEFSPIEHDPVSRP